MVAHLTLDEPVAATPVPRSRGRCVLALLVSLAALIGASQRVNAQSVDLDPALLPAWPVSEALTWLGVR